MGIDAMLISSIVQSIEKSIREMDAQPVRKDFRGLGQGEGSVKIVSPPWGALGSSLVELD
jgi:hypothetical protein